MDISIAELEHAAAPGWRGADEERLGAWLLRAADGFTGRANSALAAGDPGLPIPVAAERVQAWYDDRDLPAMIAVPYPTGRPDASELDGLLAERGWAVRSRPATVMTAQSAVVATRAAAASGGVRVRFDDAPDEGWLARYHFRGQALPPMAIRLLTSAPWQAFASIRAQGEVIAIGRVAAAAGWAGLTAIEVHPEHRRRGLGLAVTAALVASAADHGVGNVYLQVEDGNRGACALYRGLGFADHHGYHYRVAPARV
ncbi:MAG TPA: GNAT family N-acetyltransferase [Streptosporangiaceae bacterium]